MAISGNASCAFDRDAKPPGQAVICSEFIFTTAAFASAHASTIAECERGLVAAWFGGTREGADDVAIWLSRWLNGKWTEPVSVATGEQANGRRYPCWNPVLFRMADGTLRLFFKAGPDQSSWWGMVSASRDDGRTWSNAECLPDGILGPIKNKPVQLSGGAIVSPSSTESAESPHRWRVHFELSDDQGQTWTKVTPPSAEEINAIQPSILFYPSGKLQAIGRTRSGRIFATWSNDNGKTWSELELTVLPNPNSGIDAVTLQDGSQLLVYNHSVKERSPLNLAISTDGILWQAALELESGPGEYSYPSVIQSREGLVHITYTWRRKRIKHIVIDPTKLRGQPMPDGTWPAQLKK